MRGTLVTAAVGILLLVSASEAQRYYNRSTKQCEYISPEDFQRSRIAMEAAHGPCRTLKTKEDDFDRFVITLCDNAGYPTILVAGSSKEQCQAGQVALLDMRVKGELTR